MPMSAALLLAFLFALGMLSAVCERLELVRMAFKGWRFGFIPLFAIALISVWPEIDENTNAYRVFVGYGDLQMAKEKMLAASITMTRPGGQEPYLEARQEYLRAVDKLSQQFKD